MPVIDCRPGPEPLATLIRRAIAEALRRQRERREALAARAQGEETRGRDRRAEGG